MGKTHRKGHREVQKPKGKGMTYNDYDPRKVSPNTQQFEPTEADPIPRRARQAGVK